MPSRTGLVVNCRLSTEDGRRYYCPECDPDRNRPLREHDRRNCIQGPDLAPLLTRLAELTNHPEIIDQPKVYGPAVQIWAAGIVHHSKGGRTIQQTEPFEARDDAEVEECLTLCRENVCGKHQGGICRPSCGQGMILAVKARMASECCPWAGNRDHGKQW